MKDYLTYLIAKLEMIPVSKVEEHVERFLIQKTKEGVINYVIPKKTKV